jgi:hypothetical protein
MLFFLLTAKLLVNTASFSQQLPLNQIIKLLFRITSFEYDSHASYSKWINLA